MFLCVCGHNLVILYLLLTDKLWPTNSYGPNVNEFMMFIISCGWQNVVHKLHFSFVCFDLKNDIIPNTYSLFRQSDLVHQPLSSSTSCPYLCSFASCKAVSNGAGSATLTAGTVAPVTMHFTGFTPPYSQQPEMPLHL